MLILTNENNTYNLDRVPEYIDDIRYCVFDTSDLDYMDYFFVPLTFLESFYSPAMVLSIGEYTIQMPLDWSILVCDEDYTTVEVMPLTSLNDRGFYAPVLNPLQHMVPMPLEINITNIYSDIKWYFPKLRNSDLLVLPLEEGSLPQCAIFVKDKLKASDHLDLGALFG